MSIPKIYGFNKTSEAGIKVFAPSVFIQGCNLQCPFCFNSVLAKSQMKKEDEVPLDVVDKFIDEHNPEMIMISGGEPLMLKNIEKLMDHFIDQGLMIGLSTHGIFSDRVYKILPKINYVALDIKSANPKVYKFLDLIKDNNSFGNVLLSHGLLKDQKERRDDFDYEVRTTLYPPYVNLESIHKLGRNMDQGERWILQQYRPTKRLYDMEATRNVEPYDWDTLQEMLEAARTYTKEAHLRYV
jgi:pyruvate formate lyase activating enzyme